MMRTLGSVLLPVFSATVWISISEFVRNEFLLKSYWVEHYNKLGLVFPSEIANGAVWGLWSLMFAIVISIISLKFSKLPTIIISWFAGFVQMWLVIGNMGVLPYNILIFAVPLSLFEVYIAVVIIKYLSSRAGSDKRSQMWEV